MRVSLIMVYYIRFCHRPADTRDFDRYLTILSAVRLRTTGRDEDVELTATRNKTLETT